MKRILQLAILVVLLSPVLRAQYEQVIDSVVAVVNSSPVFQSDWEIAVRYEGLMNGRAPESFTPDEHRAVFNRLVDQVLVRQQMRGFELVPITGQDVQSRLREVRNQLPGASTDEGWKSLLAQNDITEAEVSERIRVQLEVLRFLDYRMRPMVRLEQRAVSKYYREVLVPDLRKQGIEEPPLSQVSDKIREILTQQRMEEQTALWLQTLREVADIRIASTGSPAPMVMTQTK